VPYGENEVPVTVKNQSKGVIALYRKVFNQAYADCTKHNRGDCDNKSRQAAWSAVKAKYYKGTDGKWKPKKRAYDLKDSFSIDDPDLPINVAVTLSKNGISVWVAEYNDAKTKSCTNAEARDFAWDAIKEKFEYNPDKDEWEVRCVNDIERAFSHNSTLAKSEPKWSEVDKTKLPNSAFAVPSKRKYPHHFIKNGVMYLYRGGLRAGITRASGGGWGGKEKAGKDADAKEAMIHMKKHAKAIGMGDYKKESVRSLGEAFLDALADVNILVAKRSHSIPLIGDGKAESIISANFTTERSIDTSKETKKDKVFLTGEGTNTKPDRYRAKMADSFVSKMKKLSKGLPIFDWHKHSFADSLGYVDKVSGDSSSLTIRGAIESPDENPYVGMILRKQQFGIPIYYSITARILDAQLVEEGKNKDYYIEYLDGEPLEYSLTMIPGAMVSPIEAFARSLDLSGFEHLDLRGIVHRGCNNCGLCSCGSKKNIDEEAILKSCGDTLDRVNDENIERASKVIDELKSLTPNDRGKIGDFVLRGLTDIVSRSIVEGSVEIMKGLKINIDKQGGEV
jgi:cation transport regulator ChaB